MEKLIQTQERDLRETIEAETKIEIEIIYGNTGITQIFSKNNPTEKLGGMVAKFGENIDDTGKIVSVEDLTVLVRASSLDIIPGPNERIVMRISLDHGDPENKKEYYAERPNKEFTKLGMIKFNLTRLI